MIWNWALPDYFVCLRGLSLGWMKSDLDAFRDRDLPPVAYRSVRLKLSSTKEV